MKKAWSVAIALAALLAAVPMTGAAAHKVIFDTDFAMPPQDDGLALALALNSPELEILGVTTVAGNFSMERATSDALRMLEIARREEIPVYAGANMPLVHEKTEFATHTHGEWWSDAPPPMPPGGFAKKKAEPQSAVDFIAKTVMAHPGEIEILAIGPLTNIAMAIRTYPDLAPKIKQLVIMGGAVATLPDGGGNATPNAEFNFWVDPEAARMVLRSGIPINLSALNVSRKTRLTKEWYDRIVKVDTPITRLIAETMGPHFAKDPGLVELMFDQVAVASLIDPTLVTTREMYVDVDADHDVSYGTSVGWERPTLWPYADGAQRMRVQYDLDWNRFITMFVERVTKPVPSR